MKRFWLKMLLYACPFGAVLGVPVVVLALSGELSGVEAALALQARVPRALFGPAYSYPVKRYKVRAIELRRPALLVLGSSRVMQFRARAFAAPDRFYNAGGAVATVWDARHVLGRIPVGAEPKVILFGVDQWWLNPRWVAPADLGPQSLDDEDQPLNIIQRKWKQVYRDLRSGKIELGRVWRDRSSMGIFARMRGEGFRYDGSYDYGDCTAPEACPTGDKGFEDTFTRIARGERRFEWSDDLDEAAVAEMALFLDAARARGIQVVGFLPPFAPAVSERLRASGKYGYLAKLAPRLGPIFGARGFPLVDCCDAQALAATDAEFIDGFHGSAKTYMRILLRLGEVAPALRGWFDAAAVQAQLARAGRFDVASDAP